MDYQHFACHKTVACLLPVMAFAASLAASAALDELPARKAGLWEINMHVQGLPDLGPLQQCIDRNTDELMLRNARKKDCRVIEIRRSGSTVNFHSVCQMQGSTATTDGVFVGSFASSYTGRMTTRFKPPWNGMSASDVTHAAHWIGPCKAGQKPGDMRMPNIGGIYLNELLKPQR